MCLLFSYTLKAVFIPRHTCTCSNFGNINRYARQFFLFNFLFFIIIFFFEKCILYEIEHEKMIKIYQLAVYFFIISISIVFFPNCLMRKASCCKFIIYRVAVNTWQQLSFCCIYILQPDTFNIYNTTKDFFRKLFHILMILTYYLTNRMMYTYLYTFIDKRGPVKILNQSNSTILKKSCTLCKMILELFLI